MSPNSLQALELMKRFGDAKGNVDYEHMEAEEPNWQNLMGNPRKPSMIFSAMRQSGRFAGYLKGAYGPPAGQASEGGPPAHASAEALSADERVVLEIAGKYRKPNGRMDWKAAYAAHPEWRQQLSYRNHDDGIKGSHVLKKLKDRGILTMPDTAHVKAGRLTWKNRVLPHGHGGEAAVATNASGNAPTKQEGLSADEQLVLEVASKYTIGTKVKWLQAVQDHPEWVEGLNFAGHRTDFQRGKNALKKLKMRGLIGTKIKKYKTANAEAEHPAPPPPPQLDPAEAAAIERRIKHEVNRGVDAALAEMGFCPRCGNNLRAMFRAAAFAAKLGQ